jgi:T5SS/PEP-CTERM-associated repeat protein
MTERQMTFSGDGLAGDLFDPNNWVGGIAPGANDSALITMNVGGPIGGTVILNNMMLLGKETITFTGTVDLAGVGGDCLGLMVCVGAGAIFTPGAVLNDGNTLIVGNGAPGTLIAEGSGSTHSVINSVTAKLGIGVTAIGTVTIDDAIWNNSGAVQIGYLGSGTLNVVDGGSAIFGGSVNLSVQAGSSGRITIASGGSVDIAGQLMLGDRAIVPDTTASISVGSGGSLTVDGPLCISAGSQLDLAVGTVNADGSMMLYAGGVISGYGTMADLTGMAINGTMVASGGTLEVEGNIGGTTGTLQIDANSTAMLTGSTVKLAGISFSGADATLSLAHGANVTGPISGFAVGDAIDMANVDAASFTASTGMLVLSDQGVNVDSLHLLGNFTGDTFIVQQTVSGAVISMDAGGLVGGTVSVNNMTLLGNQTTTFTGTLDIAGVGGASEGLTVSNAATAIFTPGATLNDANALIVGDAAVGTLLAEGSGATHSAINAASLFVGRLAGGVGTITIDDSVLHSSGSALIGDIGTGTLNVTDNGSASFGGGVSVAYGAGSVGQITIASGGSMQVGGSLWIGYGQSGSGGTGAVSVGSGSSLTVDQAIGVGSSGQLDLIGGTVTAGAVGSTIVTLAGGLISGYGTLAVPDGEAITNAGTIRASGGNLQMDESVTGTGSLQIAADSTATITGATLKLAGISFIGPDSTLSLAHGATVTAPISGFAIGDIIAMANVTTATFTASTGMLVLGDNGVNVDSLHLLGSFTGDTFSVQQTLSDSFISLHHS